MNENNLKINDLDENNEGLLLVDKPKGRSSFSVVAEIRRKTGVKKVGHAGTLDPFASGLLIIFLGKKYTRMSAEFLGIDKEYEALIDLSKTSTTGDPEGKLTEVLCEAPDKIKIAGCMKKFIGQSMQTPHRFSAVKVSGKRAYSLAREGVSFKLKPKKINVYNLEIVFYSFPFVKIKTKVSAGTYIRVLAEDIGRELGCGGYLVELRRTSIDKYCISKSIKLDDIKNSQ